MDTVFVWISQYGYAALFLLLMLGIAGLPIPDETLLTFCGYLIWRGRLNPLLTFVTGFAGSACGISLSYVLGRTYGLTVIDRFGRYIRFGATQLQVVHEWFGRMGAWLLAVGYFIPGVRHFTALVAGTSGMRWPTFALFAYAGAAIWVLTFLTLGYVVGERWNQASEAAHKYVLEGTGALALLLGVAWCIRKLRARRARSQSTTEQ